MDSGLLFLFIFVGIVLGVVSTIIVVRIIKNHDEVAGTLIICKREEDVSVNGFDNPYIWFQISKPSLVFNTKKRYILLKVKRVKQDDNGDRLIDISQK